MTTYPTHVFLAVLASAVLHAGWNALIRGGRDPLLHTAAIVFWAALVAAPFLAFVTLPDAASLPYMAVSNGVHMLYYVALAAAYRSGTLSFAYPIIRGTAPLIIALGSLFFFSETPGWFGWLGILCVSAGVLIVALRAGANGSAHTIAWSLLCACTIAAYSLADGMGVRQSHSVAGYSAVLYTMEGLVFVGGMVVFGRSAALARYVIAHWRSTLFGGVMSTLAYGISLWAMAQAPVALVAATRETSVLFATLIGVWFLRERLSLRQWAGAATIMLGVVLLRA